MRYWEESLMKSFNLQKSQNLNALKNKVVLFDCHLTISAKKEASKDENEDNYIRKERSSCSLQRSFYLENADKETASAEFDKGVLKINLPKAKDVEKKKDNSIVIK